LSGGALNQTAVSRLERGLTHPVHDLSIAQLEALLQALRWTPEEFFQATGFRFPLVYRSSREPPEEVVYMPVMASRGSERPRPNEEVLPIPRSLVRPGSILIQVDGDSMDTRDEGGIRGGDLVLVDQNLRDLKPGKVYALEIVGGGIVIRRALKTKNGWVFVPDDLQGPVLEPGEVVILGEAYCKVSIREVK